MAMRGRKQLGHTIVPPRPALVPLQSPATWVHELSGVTIPDVRVQIVAADSTKPAGRTAWLVPVHALRPLGPGADGCEPRGDGQSRCDRLASRLRFPADIPRASNCSNNLPTKPRPTASEPVGAIVANGCRDVWPKRCCSEAGIAARSPRRGARQAATQQVGRRDQAAGDSDQRHAGIQEGRSHRRRRESRGSRFAHDAEQARAGTLIWRARFSTSTARSAATTSRPRSAPAGSRANRYDVTACAVRRCRLPRRRQNRPSGNSGPKAAEIPSFRDC